MLFYDFLIRAFCAGGDVKACYNSIMSSREHLGTGQRGILSHDFFREEYVMNYKMGVSNISQISIWNGIVSNINKFHNKVFTFF
jgi:enoyl-CoA hydratase/carnithine racemase